MNIIKHTIEESEQDYNVLLDALDNVLFAAAVHRLSEVQDGRLPVPEDVEAIRLVRCLYEDMKMHIAK